MNIRPAGDADLSSCQHVWEACSLTAEVLGSLTRPAPNPLYSHELETGELVVAEGQHGEVIGFGAAVIRSGRWYLADLFVHPTCHGDGVGSALLERLLLGASDARVTIASSDLAAQALYMRAGMVPRWPSYTLVGTLPCELRPPWLRAEPVDWTCEGPALVALDRRLSGVDRPEDLAWWSGPAGGTALWLVDESGARRGYAVVADRYDAVLAPELREAATVITAVVDRKEQALDAVAASIGWAAGRGRRRVRLLVPAPHPALVPLLEAGFRIIDTDLFCASDESLFDGRRAIPSSTVL
jgi:GNAT superfamily N-acetyltransferase